VPYFIEQVPTGWNTVKDDGVVLGKHKTKAQAIAQMIAVSLSEGIPVGGERAVDPNESYSPPAGVAVAAKRALKWIDKGLAGDGFTAVGRRRAFQLASGADISGETVNRMKSYFARHAVDKQATGFSAGDEGYPSPGRVAFDAWGGESGESWVNGLSSVSATRAVGDRIGISDFDDTLFVSGGLNQAVYDFIQSQDVELYVVTGRHEADRGATVDLLNKLNVSYSKLIMQPDDMQDSAKYKGDVAGGLLAEGLDVVFVVENNAEARAAYRNAGLENVVNPDELSAVNGVRSLEDYSLSKEELVVKVGHLKADTLHLIHYLSMTVEQLSDLVDSVAEPVSVVEDVVEDMPEMLNVSSNYMKEDERFVNPSKVAELHERGERVMSGIEQRVAVSDLEIRQEGDGMTLRGYAAIFNSPSQPLPFIETIEPGAFRDSLKNDRNDIKLLWNHDTSIVLGSTRAGTLRLVEDERGLLVEASLPMTQAGKDAAISIQRGDVTAFSFGFRIPAGGDEWASASERVLKRVNVHEVSVGVAFPAYTATDGTATVRAMNELSEKILKLAELRGVSAEELTDALLALESGEELTERQGDLLTDTLGKVLKKDPEVNNAQDILDLKKKQLDLLMSRV
jgi:HK97 family phage prohead protease